MGAHLTRRRPPAGRGAPAGSAPVPGDDFDFESANARFTKEKLAEDNAEENHDDEEHEAVHTSTVYNKGASFFDNLSCETLERQEPRGDKQKQSLSEQRKIDTETFGTANLHHGGRGGMRGGRGGRGRYHGGGGNYHPRDNNNNNRGGDRRDNRVFRPVNNNNAPAQNSPANVPKDEVSVA